MTKMPVSSAATPQYTPGTLVRARGRDWVVLPDSSAEILRLQPLGGSGEEVTGIFLPLEGEQVRPATFSLPDPARVGDARSCRLLREAARLGFRSGAGPFRSFGSMAVEPRPYQLVPLLMALQQQPVRLMIADDVGIGKTVEAGLIARELLERGDIETMAVLCPPHLAEQWVQELRDKFHLEAVAVLSATASGLEKNCALGESLFQYHPVTVVSLDYIKSDRRREDFLRNCPDLVIVDEAHTCAQAGVGTRQQRHKLLRQIAARPTQHLLLVTATPHSGNADAFRSLLGLLQPHFEQLPQDLSGAHNAAVRKDLARYLVQRRRADILHYSAADTPFPQREEKPDAGYNLSPEYKRFFDKVLQFARETVQDTSGGPLRQRVRWWAALGLLRALASSPAAAAATLEARANTAQTNTVDEADELGRRGIFDLEDETNGSADLVPGTQLAEPDEASASHEAEAEAGAAAQPQAPLQPAAAPTPDAAHNRRLRGLAQEARLLAGAADHKLELATREIKTLLSDGYSPIVFCRFLATAEELRNHLRAKLKGVEVVAVTGMLSPEDRKAAVEQLAQDTQEGVRRVLVATDCLSEGINLQAYFDAVVHYDLAWNPTRHEQREGRVDRYGQPSPRVRVLTVYGKDNQIDGLVLDVLLRKGQEIRRTLGVSVPVPTDSDAVAEAIFEGLLLRGKNLSTDQLALFDDLVQTRTNFHQQWELAGEREKKSRALFAQHAIKPEDVAREVEAMKSALGGAGQVQGFVRDTLAALGQQLSPVQPVHIDLNKLPEAVAEPLKSRVPRAAFSKGLKGRFDTANAAGETLLGRTHPLVASLASYILETALDETLPEPVAARCGAMRTTAVGLRTTLLLLRLRFHLHQRVHQAAERALLAEDCLVVGFQGAPENATWLTEAEAEALLLAQPAGNIGPDQAAAFVASVEAGYPALLPHLEQVSRARADELLQAHKRARDATKSGGSIRVEAQLPPDVLGLWVFLPPLPKA